MKDRRTAVIVAVALLAGAAVAGVGLATNRSGKHPRTVEVDEVTGRIGRAVLGETEQNVVGALGRPESRRDLPTPPNFSAVVLRYPHLEIWLADHRVARMKTDDPAARTDKIVRIGDPLSAARALYRKSADCVPNSPDKTAKHPHCVVTVPSGFLRIDGDPIRTMTLARAD